MRTPRWLEWLCKRGDEWTFCGPTPEEEARWAALEFYAVLRQSMNMLTKMSIEKDARADHAARVARTVEGREKYGLTWDGRVNNA